MRAGLVSGKSAISPQTAVRLDLAFGGGAETQLKLQVAYDPAVSGQNTV